MGALPRERPEASPPDPLVLAGIAGPERPRAGRQSPDPAGGSGRPDRVPPVVGRPWALEAPGPTGVSTSTFVYGSCRPLVNLLLFAAAQAADPSLHWLEVRTPVDAVSVPDPVDLGWIDDRHHWTVDPSEAFSLDNGPANAALFQLVRDDEPPETLARLTEFLRLPPRMQKILSEGAPGDRGAVIAVANADRTAEAFPSASLPPILEALAWAGYSLFVAYCGAAPDGRRRFGTVLRVEGESVERWNDARLIVESAPGRGGLGPTAAVRLSEMPFAAQVLRRATQQH